MRLVSIPRSIEAVTPTWGKWLRLEGERGGVDEVSAESMNTWRTTRSGNECSAAIH
jgi:hypothetical protein